MGGSGPWAEAEEGRRRRRSSLERCWITAKGVDRLRAPRVVIPGGYRPAMG